MSTYLKCDGVFVLRMITMQAGLIYGTDIILHLWKQFYDIEIGNEALFILFCYS